MKRFFQGVLLVSGMSAVQAQDATTVARLHVQATDYAVGRTLAYCLARAPAHVAPINTAWLGWRQRFQVEPMRREVPQALYDTVIGRMDPDKLEATLVAQGPAERVCATFPATLNDKSMDMRAQYPAAYVGLVAAAAPPATAAQATPPPAAAPAPVRNPIRTEPGQGVARSDIAAVLYLFRSANGFKVKVLLKDGWMYDRGDVPPEDLDVQASREREPTRWHRWKKEGNAYHVRFTDSRGKLRDNWERLNDVITVTPWPDGRSVAGEYINANFTGSIGLGGVYSQDTWWFGKDGRFSSSAYTQASAGSWAAANGYSSAQTSYSGSNGSSSSSSIQAGGTAFTSADAKRAADGAGRRGSYSVRGYTLELHYDNGAVRRLFAFPWSDRGVSIDGRTFIVDPSKK